MGNGKFLVIKSGNYGIIGECQRPARTALKSMDALAHKETGFFYRDLGCKPSILVEKLGFSASVRNINSGNTGMMGSGEWGVGSRGMWNY